MACDVETLCQAPCDLDLDIKGASAQAWALSQALARISTVVTGETAPTIEEAMATYPCLSDCVSTQQALQKMASIIYSSTTFATSDGRYCWKDNQVAGYSLFLMCNILNTTN